MRIASIVSLGAALLFVSRPSAAQPVEVTQLNGLVSIHCKDASLASVFEKIEEATGIKLTLEDEVKAKKLTANLVGLPVSMAVSRLLEGVGVNYIVMMDPGDWGRVDKIFVGGGGGSSRATAGGPTRSPVVEEQAETFEEAPPESYPEGMEEVDPSAMGDTIDPNLEAAPEDMQNPEEFGVGQEPSDIESPPEGSSPVPEYLPPTQQFPRSNFTPGLPRGNQRQNNQFGQSNQTGQPNGQMGTFGQPGMTQGQSPNEQDPANPGMFPFTDPFGRPIPVPPGTNPQQQTPQQRKQQQRQQ